MSKKLFVFIGSITLAVVFLGAIDLFAQSKDDKRKAETTESIGGKEHDSNILGVTIGMDVPTALRAVFVNANRKPGQEKPDAKRNEGKDNKDIRVLYKDLQQGELQIVFAEGKWVKEIVLKYSRPYRYSDLRLPYSGDVRVALNGERYDDRYTIGYTDIQRLVGLWWRDEKTQDGYRVRIIFTSGNRLKESQFEFQNVVQKAIIIMPDDQDIFIKAMHDRQ